MPAPASAPVRAGLEPRPPCALSVRQPWAALLACGLKTVEVRTWPTARRGPILIHAAKGRDDRPEAWARIATPELNALAALRGGVIGVAELVGCVRYASPEEFAEAEEEHLNAPGWYRAGGLHGFVFQNARVLAYHACPGRTLFFEVPDLVPPG